MPCAAETDCTAAKSSPGNVGGVCQKGAGQLE